VDSLVQKGLIVQRLLRIALFTALCLLFLLPTRKARAEGALVARAPTGEEKGLFPLTRTEVSTEIHGRVIATAVTQRFENKFTEKIEAVYVFPLPNNAAVDDMEMHIGDRVVRAEIQTRTQARATYDRAVQRGQRAALLEQERPNIFTFSVANIDPGREIEVKLHYFQVAHYDQGTYEMAFPMVVGPRYIPGQPLQGPQAGTGASLDTHRVPDASRISPAYVPPGARSGHTIGLSVKLDAGSAIEAIECKTHAVGLNRPSLSTAQITLKADDEIPNRDFVLRWRVAAPELRPSVFAYRPDKSDDGYLALLLEPRHDAPVTEIAPREIFFLLDTSGSMQGPPIATAVAAVKKALATLHPSDSFQIIDFADEASSFSPAPLPNRPEMIKRARAYLDGLVASGGTNQLAGIHAALTAPGDSQRLRYVVFMTDGYIGNEAEVLGLVKREIGNARIFGFGIGGSVNRYLLDEVSLAGRGAAEYLRPHEDATAIIQRFYERIGRPYLTDVQIDWGSFGVSDVQPSIVPDLSTFQPLVVFGRYRGSGAGTIEIKGRIAMRPFSKKINVNLPSLEPNGSAIGRLWAREKIANLTRAMHEKGETQDLVAAITKLGLAQHLVTQYTSLVAVDPSAPADDPSAPRLINQPAEAPEDVNLKSAGGSMMRMAAYSPPPGIRGCGGCVTAESTHGDAPLLFFSLGALVILARRRRRTQS
jgi:Ca-activated chloride channel family protein